MKATSQGLFTTMLIGFGFATGNLVSGILIDVIGVRGMYAATSGVLFLGLGLVLSLGKLLRIFRRWLFTSLNGRVTITASL